MEGLKNTMNCLVPTGKLFRLPWKAVECRGHGQGGGLGKLDESLGEICQNRMVHIPLMGESASISSQTFVIWQNDCH